MNIVNQQNLLAQIARQLMALEDRAKLIHVNVGFYLGEELLLETYLARALDYLANDVYWNEEGNWSLADTAKVSLE